MTTETYDVQQDNAGWVVVKNCRDGVRRAWSHHETKIEAQRERELIESEHCISRRDHRFQTRDEAAKCIEAAQ